MRTNRKSFCCFLFVLFPLAVLAGPPGNTILGAYVGNDSTAVTSMEHWLGRPIEGVLSYVGPASWADWTGSLGWEISSLWATVKANHKILWSIPLIPKGATLDSASLGLYNSRYLAAANTLKNFRPQDSVIYVRTAWEFNGNWFADSAVGRPHTWIGAWIQFVKTFRSVSTRFRFDWCPNFGITNMAPDLAYPGDSVVDIIGMDFYDETIWCHIADPAARWTSKMNQSYGLKWHHDFAAAHGKPMSYPEWGVGGNGAGDAPYIVEQMYNWFRDNQVVYQTLWNSNSAYTGMLSNNQYPNAGAKYISLYNPQVPIRRYGFLSVQKPDMQEAVRIFDLSGRSFPAAVLPNSAAPGLYIGTGAATVLPKRTK
jgi:hypothetical protein